jgi:hypothetical protein
MRLTDDRERGMDAAKVRSGWQRSAGGHLAALAALALSVAAAAPAAADPGSDPSARPLWRHGMVSRHFWAPASMNLGPSGMRLSAGLAVGVRAPLRATVGAAVAPAFVLDTGGRSSLTLLRAEQGGAMLVWQMRH